MVLRPRGACGAPPAGRLHAQNWAINFVFCCLTGTVCHRFNHRHSFCNIGHGFALRLHVVHSWPSGEKVLHMPAPWLGMWYHQRPAPLAGDEVLLPQPGGWKVNNSVKSVVKMCDTRSSAKVSNKNIEDPPTHVICVYVDPFWDDHEMMRVLRGLREHCGIREELKFEADAITLLEIRKDNAHSVPISLFVSPKGSLAYEPLVPVPQTASERNICVHFGTTRGCRNGPTCTFAHVQKGGE
jgi:hypothetical protein